MNEWDALAKDIFDVVWAETKGLWKGNDTSFLLQFVQDLAREKWSMHQDGADIGLHKTNIEHLLTTMMGELLRKRIVAKRRAIPVLIKVLRVVVQVVVITRLVTVKNETTN